jgi:hypothetical protein
VLTSRAGAVNNPQEYVVAARISTKYENVDFIQSSQDDKNTVTMRFITTYIPLVEDQLTQPRSNPSILPKLPKDITVPFTSS